VDGNELYYENDYEYVGKNSLLRRVYGYDESHYENVSVRVLKYANGDDCALKK